MREEIPGHLRGCRTHCFLPLIEYDNVYIRIKPERCGDFKVSCQNFQSEAVNRPQVIEDTLFYEVALSVSRA